MFHRKTIDPYDNFVHVLEGQRMPANQFHQGIGWRMNQPATGVRFKSTVHEVPIHAEPVADGVEGIFVGECL